MEKGVFFKFFKFLSRIFVPLVPFSLVLAGVLVFHLGGVSVPQMGATSKS